MTQHTCAVCLLTFHFFAGELPKELGKLASLTVLYLNNNKFGGESYVPSYIRKTASKFNLNFPQITGTIPVEFGQLVNLQTLGLGGNKLAGAIVCPIIIHNSKCI